MTMKQTTKWIVLIGTLLSWCGAGFAAEQKIALMLGGQYCEAYLGDVEAALAKLSGVKAVDLKSMKGHALVTIDGEKVNANQLAAAVNGVKGDGWHCSGQVMK